MIDLDSEIEDFRLRVHRQSISAMDEETGDFLFNAPDEQRIRENLKFDAAVFIGLIGKPDGPHVLLTQRNPNMRAHSGQVAFPGGKIDPEDQSVTAAAMRECEEETGIGPAHIEVLGPLPMYLSGTGYRVYPVIGLIKQGYQIRPNHDEVAAIFEVPLAFLMDPANHKKASRELMGAQRFFYEIPYQDWYIWGMTAGIIRVMYERLYR